MGAGGWGENRRGVRAGLCALWVPPKPTQDGPASLCRSRVPVDYSSAGSSCLFRGASLAQAQSRTLTRWPSLKRCRSSSAPFLAEGIPIHMRRGGQLREDDFPRGRHSGTAAAVREYRPKAIERREERKRQRLEWARLAGRLSAWTRSGSPPTESACVHVPAGASPSEPVRNL